MFRSLNHHHPLDIIWGKHGIPIDSEVLVDF